MTYSSSEQDRCEASVIAEFRDFLATRINKDSDDIDEETDDGKICLLREKHELWLKESLFTIPRRFAGTYYSLYYF